MHIEALEGWTCGPGWQLRLKDEDSQKEERHEDHHRIFHNASQRCIGRQAGSEELLKGRVQRETGRCGRHHDAEPAQDEPLPHAAAPQRPQQVRHRHDEDRNEKYVTWITLQANAQQGRDAKADRRGYREGAHNHQRMRCWSAYRSP